MSGEERDRKEREEKGRPAGGDAGRGEAVRLDEPPREERAPRPEEEEKEADGRRPMGIGPRAEVRDERDEGAVEADDEREEGASAEERAPRISVAEDLPEVPEAEVFEDEPLTIADREFRSRLIVGTGKYGDDETMVRAIRASGAEMVTVAVRRVDLDAREEGILHHLDPDEFMLLANTAGCYTAEEAVRYARLARSAGFNEWLKLEVIGDQDTLLPDVRETIEAAETLTAEGFKVLAYTNEDLVSALRLEDAGCVAVMPLASPIGSGLGLVNPYYIREMKRRLEVPVIVDAGVGTASDACETMEQGVDGILMNTALAEARDPVAMATAMRHAIVAGRLAYLAGRMEKREIALPSSPVHGMLD